ncbi:MAG: AAA family ATPase, partial [Planctomycetes bacterium]|nr:AAA family ATPase [Planctomycetota bacterium]
SERSGKPMPHTLLTGPPGLGKTTIARLVAQELGVGFRETSATAIRTPVQFLGMLAGLRPRDVFFVDEIHGLDAACQDFLLSALEGDRLHLSISHGVQTRNVTVLLDPFTLIGATTDPAHLSNPLLARLKNARELEPYGVNAIAEMIARAAGRAGDAIAPEAVYELARRSRGNGREAIRLLDAARILTQASGASAISGDIACRSAEHLGVDENGLRAEERRLLAFLVAERRAVGLRTSADFLGLDDKTVRDIHEPYLVRSGWIRRTPWGRKATDKAVECMGGAGSRPVSGTRGGR